MYGVGPGTVTSNNATYACRTSHNLPEDNPDRCTGNSVSAKNLHLLVDQLVRGIASDLSVAMKKSPLVAR